MTKGKDSSELECMFYRLSPENKNAIITQAEGLGMQQEADNSKVTALPLIPEELARV